MLHLSTLLLFFRSPRAPGRALYHTLWCGPDHPLDQRGPRTCSHHTLRYRSQTFRWVLQLHFPHEFVNQAIC